MDNKVVSLILSLVVGVIVVGSVLVPILNDAASDTEAFSNRDDALFEMNKVDSSSEYTLIWRADVPDIIEVNGSSVVLSGGTILCSIGDTSIRYVDGSNKRIQIFGSVNNYGISENNVGAVATIQISNGEYVYSSSGLSIGDFSVTEPLTEGYVIVPKGTGDFVMKSPNQNAYVLRDSPIVAMGITAIGSAWNVGFTGLGTIDGIEVSQYSGSTTYTISDVTIDSNIQDNFVGLYTMSKFTFDATDPNDSTVTTVTYNYFIVPASVIADKANGSPLGDYHNLVFAIPLVVIVALLVMATALFRRY